MNVIEYSIINRTESSSAQYSIHICADTALQMNLRGELKERFCMQAKGDYLNPVHADQMVFEIVRWGG